MDENDDSPLPEPAPAETPADPLLRSILSGAQGRIDADRGEAYAAAMAFYLEVTRYRSPEQLLALMEPEQRAACERAMVDRPRAYATAPGSSRNHQAWVGGYRAHQSETMNIGCCLYALFSRLRPLPFTLASALFVLFFHDDEKLSRYVWDEAARSFVVDPTLTEKTDKRARREEALIRYGAVPTDDERNALRYVEGEHGDYSPDRPAMGPLAAFCHLCDTWSARGWPGYPMRGDPWGDERLADPD